jgi:hypothetical protein
MIRRDIEQTRSALTEKLESLEQEVMGTVRGARSAVTETIEAVKGTVENVKGSVEGAVESVKEQLDVKRQFRRHPWTMFGLSVGTGFVVGAYLPSPSALRQRASRTTPSSGTMFAGPEYQAEATERRQTPAEGRMFAEPAYQAECTERRQAASSERSFLGGLVHQLQPEWQQFKGLAIGAALGVVRDALHGTLPPSLKPKVEALIHNVTRRVGGETIEGPILSSEEGEREEHRGYHRRF